jgi:hypothetical protein
MNQIKSKVYFKNISSNEAQMLNMRTDEVGYYYTRSTRIQAIVNKHIDAREAIQYSKGKIYKITSPHTSKIYIGSTVQTISISRIGQHKCHRDCTSLGIINAGDATI